jgi:cation diffusion facilitator family transporter
MDACCNAKALELEKLKTSQKHVLQIVLGINAVFFLVEFIAGLLAHSTALLADSLDMFGDALVYAFSLYVLTKSLKWRAGAGLLKGIIMASFGLAVLLEAFFKLRVPVLPEPQTMGTIGTAVLIANGICFLLLYRHRSDDINMRSTWLCSRNDIIANLSVLIAAAAVAVWQSSWPDIIIGAAIAALFLKSAFTVLYESFAELRQSQLPEQQNA